MLKGALLHAVYKRGGEFMSKRAMIYFIIGILIVLVSTPLGYSLAKIVYHNMNLAGEFFNVILNGFIHSLMLIGILVSSIGITTYIKDK